MQPNATQLQELHVATGVMDFGAVTHEQFAEVLKRAAEKRLSLEHLKMLVGVMPQFVQLQRDLITGLKEVTKGAQGSQQAVLQVMGRALDSADQALQALAQNAQTDEVRLEIAKITFEVGEQGLELARIGERMNKDNNNFWWQIWGTTATATVALASVALFVFSGGRGNVPKA